MDYEGYLDMSQYRYIDISLDYRGYVDMAKCRYVDMSICRYSGIAMSIKQIMSIMSMYRYSDIPTCGSVDLILDPWIMGICRYVSKRYRWIMENVSICQYNGTSICS